MLSLKINTRSIPQDIYILEHTIVLAEVNKSHNMPLLKITPCNKCMV